MSEKLALFGRPPTFSDRYNGDAAYKSTFFQQAPLLTIVPGRIDFQNTDQYLATAKDVVGLNSDPKSVNADSLRQSIITELNEPPNSFKGPIRNRNYDVDDLSAKAQDLLKGTARYFDFKPTITEYQSVVSVLYGRLAATLGSKITPTLFDTTFFSRLNYWVDPNSSVSESMGTETGPTVLAGLTGSVNSFAKQAKFLLKEDELFTKAAAADGAVTADGAPAAADGSAAAPSGLIASAISSLSGMVGGGEPAGIRAALGDAMLGMNPLFPEVWKNSTFDRSYTINFKFASPYADASSIMLHTIFPFLTLLALVGPQQRTATSFSEPFVFQIDMPGSFSCDLAICTGFSFVKGGSEKLFTNKGLPRVIDVSMSVKDLYPTMMLSKNYKALYLNQSLSLFLDNMAGLSSKESGKNLTPFNNIEQRLESLLFGITNADTALGERFTDLFLTNSVSKQLIDLFK